MRPRYPRAPAFTLVEIMIVVALIGLLVAIAIPSFVRAREHAQKNTCINNLRMIDAVKQQWALEFRKSGMDTPIETDLHPYLMRGTGGRIPVCPGAGTAATFSDSYEPNQVMTSPVCKITAGWPANTVHKLPN